MSTRRPHPTVFRRLHLALIALLALTAIGAALVLPARPAHAATAVTTSDLNLRVGFYPTSRVKLVMPEGAVVETVNRSQSPNGYWKVVYQGIRGYAHGDYLDFSGGGSDGGGGTGDATTTSALNLRARASTSAAVLLVMPEGASVSLTGERSNGFLGVVYRGTTGWASADYLSTGGGDGGDGGGSTGSARTTSELNLRSRASTNSAVLLVMPSGASVELTGQSSNGFLGVTYRGTSGWAFADYIDTSGGGGDGGGGGSSNIILPVESGSGWKVIQGYNGGTHQGTYQNALDLARVGGGTAGSAIIAPVSGTVLWNDFNSGGILIDMGNGYGVAMFHVTFDASLGRGDRVSQGQYIGTISGPGGNGYASTPHVEIDVWDIASGRVSAPFTGINALSGNVLPNDGSYNQYGGMVFYP